jgi:hypothetical protein
VVSRLASVVDREFELFSQLPFEFLSSISNLVDFSMELYKNHLLSRDEKTIKKTEFEVAPRSVNRDFSIFFEGDLETSSEGYQSSYALGIKSRRMRLLGGSGHGIKL